MARQKKPVHRVQMTEGKRNIIHQLLEEYDIQSAEDIQDALKDLLGGTIKEMMEAEMDDHLGYEKSERSDNDDYRNGYKRKQVNSRYGSMEIEVPQAIYAMLPAAVTQLVVVLKDTALGSIIMYTDLLQESRRLGSMYFNILQTLVVAAVIYFIACWLLSRLAEWLPERMQKHTAAPAEPEPVAPIAIMDPSNVNQIAVAREGVPLGGAQRLYHVHHRGSNASIRHWRQTRYVQGFDETHPESQVEFDKNGRPIKDTSKQDKLRFDKPKSDKSKGDKPKQ